MIYFSCRIETEGLTKEALARELADEGDDNNDLAAPLLSDGNDDEANNPFSDETEDV